MDNYNEKIKESCRLRSKKHYELKKTEINEIRRNRYLLKQQEKPPKAEPQAEEPVEENELDDDITSKKGISKNDILKHKLSELQINPNTKKKYLQDLTRLLIAVNNEDLIKNMKKAPDLINKIKVTDYANNTKLGMVQICLYLITNFNIVVNKNSIKLLTQYYNERRAEANDTVANKTQTEEVPTWREYIDKVRAEFGETSKMFLIANLYKELTLRDDFTLKLLNKKPKTEDENYIILNKNNYTIIINQYKTQNKYGVINVKLTKGLTGLINRYIDEQHLKEGDYLLGDKELSGYILYNNAKIGIKGGVSLFRHITVSEELSNPKITAEQRVKLADKMRHSLFIQRDYLRQMKKADSKEEAKE